MLLSPVSLDCQLEYDHFSRMSFESLTKLVSPFFYTKKKPFQFRFHLSWPILFVLLKLRINAFKKRKNLYLLSNWIIPNLGLSSHHTKSVTKGVAPWSLPKYWITFRAHCSVKSYVVNITKLHFLQSAEFPSWKCFLAKFWCPNWAKCSTHFCLLVYCPLQTEQFSKYTADSPSFDDDTKVCIVNLN